MDNASRKRADKAEWIADGQSQFSCTATGRVGKRGCRQTCSRDSQRREVTRAVHSGDVRNKLASVPKLHGSASSTKHVRIGDDQPVARTDYTGAASSRVAAHNDSRAAQPLRHFP
jgi:hypothetical protein